MKILETDGMSGTGFHKKFGNFRHKFQKNKCISMEQKLIKTHRNIRKNSKITIHILNLFKKFVTLNNNMQYLKMHLLLKWLSI